MITTPWGYTIKSQEPIGPLLLISTYNELTAGKYEGDARIEANIKAASTAIRNYCGWHIYPSKECELRTSLFDRRVSRSGSGILVQLPARFVSNVRQVQIGGAEHENFVFETSGILKVYGVGVVSEWTPIIIDYDAGLPEEYMDGIRELVSYRVTHALASPDGVQSESTGGVSITYAQNWINSARSSEVSNGEKGALTPYRLQGVF